MPDIKVGKPDTSPSIAAHTSGVREGNNPGAQKNAQGIYHDGKMTKGTAARSTGINAEDKNPIDPRMPTLSPP